MTRRRGGVVIIADARFPVREPFAGGMQAMTWHLAKGLRERGIAVTIFAAPGTDHRLGARTLPVPELTLSPAARSDVAMQPWEWMELHHAYLSLMINLGREVTSGVVHNNSLHHLPVSMADLLDVPFVTTLHTPPTPWLEPAIALTRGSHVSYVAVSHSTADSWSGITPARPHVIPNGIDPSLWPEGPGGVDLVWAGRIVPEKGLHVAIELAERTDRHLRIAGPIGDVNYWQKQIQPRLDHRITYEGHLQQRELARLLGQSAVCLVTPLWEEPYGLVAAEALACGTPILGFARGGLVEVVDGDCARLVTGADAKALAVCLREAEKLDRRCARLRAVEHCSLEAMVDAYLEFYADSSGADAA